MGFNQSKKFSKIVLIFCTILLCLSFCLQASAMRPLFEEQWLQKNPIKIQSLRKGPVPSRGGNPCTYIPDRGRGRCTLTQTKWTLQLQQQLMQHNQLFLISSRNLLLLLLMMIITTRLINMILALDHYVGIFLFIYLFIWNVNSYNKSAPNQGLWQIVIWHHFFSLVNWLMDSLV